MTDTSSTSESFTDDDIFFECPHCGKSMAIDKRGMGLTIECPDCDGLVRVPTASDDTLEEPDTVHMPTEALAKALEDSRKQIDTLTRQVEVLSQRRDALEKLLATRKEHMDDLRHEFSQMQAALDHINQVMLDDYPTED